MKKYVPEKLVKISRYQNCFPTLPKDVQEEVYARIAELTEEEKEYCERIAVWQFFFLVFFG